MIPDRRRRPRRTSVTFNETFNGTTNFGGVSRVESGHLHSILDTPADELIQNRATPRLEDSDQSAGWNINNVTLAFQTTMTSSNTSMASVASIFDGAKGEQFDGVREKGTTLSAYLKETIEAWKKLSKEERTEENAEAREKVDDDATFIIDKTTLLCVEAVNATVNSECDRGRDRVIKKMNMRRAKTLEALSAIGPLYNMADDLEAPTADAVNDWKKAISILGPDVEWLQRSNDELALGEDAATAAAKDVASKKQRGRPKKADAAAKPPAGTTLAGAIGSAFNAAAAAFSPRATRSKSQGSRLSVTSEAFDARGQSGSAPTHPQPGGRSSRRHWVE